MRMVVVALTGYYSWGILVAFDTRSTLLPSLHNSFSMQYVSYATHTNGHVIAGMCHMCTIAFTQLQLHNCTFTVCLLADVYSGPIAGMELQPSRSSAGLSACITGRPFCSDATLGHNLCTWAGGKQVHVLAMPRS